MRFFYYSLIVLCNLIIGLASLHYMRFGSYYYFVPEIKIFNIKYSQIDSLIKEINLIEISICFILLCIIYFIGHSIFKRRKNKKIWVLLSNSFFITSIFLLMFFWNSDIYNNFEFNNKILFHLFTNLLLLNSIILNIHYLTNVVTEKEEL